MNETLKIIQKRYSCRNYSDRTIDESVLNAVATIAAQSPSAMNVKPWRIIVVTNQELIKEMDEEGLKIVSEWEDKSMYNMLKARGGGAICCGAPCVVMIPMRKETGMDCGIVCQSITIAAAALGLNSLICWQAGIALTGSKGKDFKKRLGFPEDYEFGMAVLLGYEQSPGTPREPDLSKISYVR